MNQKEIEDIRARYECSYANGGPHPLQDVGTLLTALSTAHLDGVRAGKEAAAKACDAEARRESKSFKDYIARGGEGPAMSYDAMYSHCADVVRALDNATIVASIGEVKR